jgi:HEAT repeat protein
MHNYIRTDKRWLCGLIVLVLLVGCGRRSPPVAKTNVTSGTGLSTQVAIQRPIGTNEPETLEARKGTYQGKSALEWGETLKSSNAGKREQAAEALRTLGEAGYPQLREALKDRSPEVRLKAMQAIDLPILRSHQEEMVTLLMTLLTDPNPAVREQAAARLVVFDNTGQKGDLQAGLQVKQRIEALQYAAQNDPAPNVRLAAINSLRCIQSAQGGKPGKD